MSHRTVVQLIVVTILATWAMYAFLAKSHLTNAVVKIKKQQSLMKQDLYKLEDNVARQQERDLRADDQLKRIETQLRGIKSGQNQVKEATKEVSKKIDAIPTEVAPATRPWWKVW